MTRPLRDYQRQGVEFIHSQPGTALLWDMGTGKTATTLSSLRAEDLPALVIAPPRVARYTWPAEAAAWRPDLPMSWAGGTPDNRHRIEKDPEQAIVSLSMPSFTRDLANILGRQNGKRIPPFRTLIIDESSQIKDISSARTKAALRVARVTDRVIELTGTPMPMGLADLWSQAKALDGGKRLGTTLGGFRNRYMLPRWPLPNGVIPGWDPRPGAFERVLDVLGDIMCSMETPEELGLGQPIMNHVPVPLTGKASQVYKAMEADMMAGIELLGGLEAVTAAGAAVLTSKLQQLTSGFVYMDDAALRDGAHTTFNRDKLDAVQEIIDGTGSPVLVVYKFKPERDALMALPGAHSVDEPDIISRWNRGEVPILVVHPQSAGHGLNLQHGGHTMIWTTPTWSTEEWMQTNKRLHRPGQTHPVMIHVLVSPGTIDEVILDRLESRKTVQQALLDYFAL